MTVCQVLRQLVPRRIRIYLALQGAPALHLPCKGACKALELLPNRPKAFSRGWVNSKSKVDITGAMSQDPKAFILGLDRSQKCPKLPPGRVCKGNAPADVPRLTRASVQTCSESCLGAFLRLGMSLCPPSKGRVPRAQARRPEPEDEGCAWDTATASQPPSIPFSGKGRSQGEGGQDPPGLCHATALPQMSSGCV